MSRDEEIFRALEKQLMFLNDEYNKNGLELVSNQAYDEMMFRFMDLQKKYKFKTSFKPGFSSTDRNISTIPIIEPMLSISKKKNIDDVYKWLDNRDYECVFEIKLDGVAVRLIYENKELRWMHLKGDGFVGEVISHRKHLIRKIPDSIETELERVEITGEVVCYEEEFIEYCKRHNLDYTKESPRGIISGLLRRKGDKGLLEDEDLPLYFYAYGVNEALQEQLITYLDSVMFLSGEGFLVPEMLEDIPEEKPVSRYYNDGVVIKANLFENWKNQPAVGYNTYSICYKYPTPALETKVTGVSWSLKATGELVGVLNYEPVNYSGTILTSCKFEYIDKYIEEGIGIGSTIKITKSNEIIPILVDLVTPSPNKIKVPYNCPFCQNSLFKEDSRYYCKNIDCSGRLIVRMMRLTGKKGLDIDGLGIVNLNKLIDNGVLRKPSDIFNITEELLEKNSVGNIKSIMESIDIIKTKSLSKWLYALSIPTLGVSRCIEIEKIHSKTPFNCEAELLKYLTKFGAEDLFGMDGIKIASYIEGNIEEISYFLSNFNFKNTQTDEGVLVAITGKYDLSRDQLYDMLLPEGIKIDNVVTKNTKVLLVGDKPSINKIAMAERYNINQYNIVNMDFENLKRLLKNVIRDS